MVLIQHRVALYSIIISLLIANFLLITIRLSRRNLSVYLYHFPGFMLKNPISSWCMLRISCCRSANLLIHQGLFRNGCLRLRRQNFKYIGSWTTSLFPSGSTSLKWRISSQSFISSNPMALSIFLLILSHIFELFSQIIIIFL